MKFVALLSGGKDSCYNILKCQEHGHELIALANLHPAPSGPDDLDSHCFQTVGHQLLPLYAACMNVPLYRKQFNGQSVARGLQYDRAEGDEVEELHALLAFVQTKHPDVRGVASGAIASDYQRLRVENVCGRLSLVSLAYLWHVPQVQLLQGMVDAGLHSILVKVASLGLNERHLGKSLVQLQSTLIGLAEKYGCNACGEGGEFETLTLDGPMFSHSHISLQDSSTHVVDGNAVAPVAFLRPESFSLVAKEHPPSPESPEATVVHVPSDWTPPDSALPPAPTRSSTARQIVASKLRRQGSATSGLQMLQAYGGDAEAIAELTTPMPLQHAAKPGLSADQGPANAPGKPLAAAREAPLRHMPSASCATPATEAETASAVTAALEQIHRGLQSVGGSWHSVLYVHLFLRHMPHFAAANSAYRAAVPQNSAPARACVAAPLPPGVLCAIDAIRVPPAGVAGDSCRKVLHVQSHSDWAPASIGPYSQAVVWNGLLHMAGQIPLDPGSMEVTTNADIGRCVKSCGAIATALGCHLPSSLLASVTFHTTEVPHSAALSAGAALRGNMHAAPLPCDSAACAGPAADLDSSAAAADVASPRSDDSEVDQAGGVFGVEAGEERGDAYRIVKPLPGSATWEPLQLLVQVPALPKACGVEVQVIAAVATGGISVAEDSDSGDGEASPARNALEGGSWVQGLQSTTSRREPAQPALRGTTTSLPADQHTRPNPTANGSPQLGGENQVDARGPGLEAREAACAEAVHGGICLRVHSVCSAAAVSLVQISCGAAAPCAADGWGCDDAGGGGAGAAAARARARAVVEELGQIPGMLREECDRAGVLRGVLWNLRLFVDERVAAAARAELGRSTAAEASTSGVPGAEGGGTRAGDGVAGAVLADGTGWAEGMSVTEVSGLHDGSGSVMWAVRALIVCI
eukprot:jgi/Ulvmu1/12442/UM009_0094.1